MLHPRLIALLLLLASGAVAAVEQPHSVPQVIPRFEVPHKLLQVTNNPQFPSSRNPDNIGEGGLFSPDPQVIHRKQSDVEEVELGSEPQVNPGFAAAGTCPGYFLQSLAETANGMTAKLNLAGAACNIFGEDVANLTIQVTYETETR
ncbi:hypothetical protein K438DRAFT_2031359 [Mycena galopus ATCC 62051]|nr:hypothetical protein K438DRAFT_2031511 [Mycena galopus ATCC 62051]KAF8134742.1 hypothetical protein K438DRAFT_2031359 [Mycena galopus ATCC 62051]